MIDPVAEPIEDTWQRAADVAQQTVVDIANRAKDRTDEMLDAKRVTAGMTLEEFLSK